MKRNNSVEELSTKGYVCQMFKEAKEGTTVFDGIDEVLDNAIDATGFGGKIYFFYDREKDEIRVLDNGCGMPHPLLRSIMENASYHDADGISIGINGIGLKKFAAICGNLKGCTLDVLTSDGGKYVSRAILNISENDAQIIHPTIEWFENGNLDDNGINIVSGELKGTIITLKHVEDIEFTNEVIEQYSIKYAEPIMTKGKHIFINNVELNAIDPTYTIGKNDVNKQLIVDNDNRLYIANFKMEAFLEGKENEKIDFIVTSIQALDPNLLRKKHSFENKPFNYLGGIYTTRGGRFIDYGNNTPTMFAIESSRLGMTKGNGLYGDISGSLSGYNRILINLDNIDSARLFGVQSIKSKGIIPLHENPNMFNYKVKVNGVNISLFEAISYIRCFNHKFYTSTTKKANYDWNNFESDVIRKFKEYDFSTSKQVKKISVTTRGTKGQTKTENIYTIKDSACFLAIQWKQGKDNKAKIVSYSPNEECLLYRRNKEDDTLIQSLMEDFLMDFRCFADYARYDREGVKTLLVARTNQYLDETK